VLPFALCALSVINQGQPPYEMVWADRTADTRRPLVAFDDVTGWSVECDNAEATLTPSDEQRLFADHVAKLEYRRPDHGATALRLVPPAPIPVGDPFDCVNWWVYGNNWAFAPDVSTPPVTLTVIFGSPGGPDVGVIMGSVGWQEWWVMHRRLTAEQVESLGPRPELRRIEVTGGTNRDTRALYLANLSVYTEPLPPLTFEPRPERNLTPLPGQNLGANTGPGKLPFPTREETILPGEEGPVVEAHLSRDGDAYTWTTQVDDTPVTWTYRPDSGTLSDLTVQAEGEEPLRPLEGGGVCLTDPATGAARELEDAELLEVRAEGDALHARWSISAASARAEVEYVFRVWNRSLVVDVLCPGGGVGEVRFGKASGASVTQPRLVTLPYLTYGATRPAVLVMGPPERPWFLAGYPDWYRSNASRLEARNEVDTDGRACYNGAAIYLPRTDGLRNDCVERLFITLAPRFEDVLPNIANPRSPWIDATAERVWIAHGASDRRADYAGWAERARLGMSNILITDHETGWRDGGESFTLRTRTAPGRGGDESQAWYAKAIQDLGYRYGIYNNYTDFAPVNEHWDEDFVSRVADAQWRPAWPRCYHLKPSRAVELEARLSPIIQEKFHLSTAYCDVHTAVQPWDYTDFDARVPGAATFTSTYYAYGEIMLHQKATWDGPVYSEGNSHWTYVGLTDGNYGQDQGGRLPVNPWLVDFDLRKMHPLGTSFGMGMPSMFYPYGESLGSTPEERTASIDRFLAATVAFGHTGYFVQDLGVVGEARSYFMLQHLGERYAAERVATIQYASADGTLQDTSRAVASGAHERSQVRATYDNGVVTLVNGHPTESWSVEAPAALLEAVGLPSANRITLCPNGYAAYLIDGGELRFAVVSTEVAGQRVDYADTPSYLFIDGRGGFTRLAKAASDGSFSAIPDGGGGLEVIPYGDCRHIAVALGGQAADGVALDFERNEIGVATTRLSRGLVHITPVEGAISYRLTPKAPPAQALTCERASVVGGEQVTIRGSVDHSFTVPRDATPGELLFVEFEGATIDFLVRPMALVDLAPPDPGRDALRLTLTSQLVEPTEAEVRLGEATQTVALPAGEAVTVEFPLPDEPGEYVRELPLAVSTPSSELRHTWWVKGERGALEMAPLPVTYTVGFGLRGQGESANAGDTGAYVAEGTRSCNEEAKSALFMHPPWMGATGCSFARYDGIALPEAPLARLRCLVGKQDGSYPGDGVLFILAVVDAEGTETEVARRLVTEHRWEPLEADLGPWAGQTISLKLISDVGPDDDSNGDWACWADMGIESATPVLAVTVHDEPVELLHAPGPHPLEGVTLEMLRGARRGWISYEALGLQCAEPYISTLQVNEVNIGPMPADDGDEVQGRWGTPIELPLTPEAIAALTPTTVVKVANGGSDYFKVRRFCAILELADGRRFSSRVHTQAYTQPPEWAHAEGTGVPFGASITADLRFDLVE
jgi:hypothetical protein